MYRIFCLPFSDLKTNIIQNNPLRHWLKIGILTVVFMLSIAIYPLQVAQAANADNSQSHQNSQTRQTSDSIKKLPGGVESAVLKDGKNTPQPKKSSKSKMKKLRDELPGTSANSKQSNQKTQKNQTSTLNK